MYKIEIHNTAQHRIHAEYTISGDLVIIRRHSYRDIENEWEDINIGLSIEELVNLVYILKIRKGEHDVGIDPPEHEKLVREHDSYMDDM